MDFTSLQNSGILILIPFMSLQLPWPKWPLIVSSYLNTVPSKKVTSSTPGKYTVSSPLRKLRSNLKRRKFSGMTPTGKLNSVNRLSRRLFSVPTAKQKKSGNSKTASGNVFFTFFWLTAYMYTFNLRSKNKFTSANRSTQHKICEGEYREEECCRSSGCSPATHIHKKVQVKFGSYRLLQIGQFYSHISTVTFALSIHRPWSEERARHLKPYGTRLG